MQQRDSSVLHLRSLEKRNKIKGKFDRRIRTAKYFMTTLSLFFHGPFMNEASPFTARVAMRKSGTETERGQEKVKMKEIYEWSLGTHPRCSDVCQIFASEHGNKSESRPP